MRTIRHIVIHCTATPQTATVQSIQNHWRNVLKWRNPGYHVLIEANGTVHRLAPDSAICNGVAGHNQTSLHVSYIGGVDKSGKPVDNRTPQQTHSMIQVISQWLLLYPSAIVQGHRDFPKVRKACPSFDARAWWRTVQSK